MARDDRKVRIGQVIGHKMDKTAIVEVRWSLRHPIYNKLQRQVSKFYAHDQDNDVHVGDVVKIQETRPISHLKRWRIIEVVQRREVAEVKPIELDRQVLEAGETGEHVESEAPAAEATAEAPVAPAPTAEAPAAEPPAAPEPQAVAEESAEEEKKS